MPYVDQMSEAQARTMLEGAADNDQIWNASKCKTDYLPRVLRHLSRYLNALGLMVV